MTRAAHATAGAAARRWIGAACIAVALLLSLGIAGCGGDEDTQPADPATEPAGDAAGGDQGATTDDGAGTADDASGDDPPSAGIEGEQTFVAGEVGAIAFTLREGSLSLGEVRPAGGWRCRVDEEDDDELGVDCRDGEREVELDVGVENGGLNFKIEYERGTPRGRQTVVAGSAGEVHYATDGGALDLRDVRPSDGWDHVVDDEESDEIEIDFRSDQGDVVELEIELDG